MSRDRLSLVAVGDVIPTRRMFRDGEPVTAGFGKIVDLISSGDAAVANLDTALTTRGYPREKLINCRTTPELAPDLRRIGFDVISLANNHVMDYGETGLFDTLEALESAGVAHVGAGAELKSAAASAVVEARGWRVAVLAWTCVLPTGAAASPERPGQAPLHVHTAFEVNPYLQMEEPTSAPIVRTRVDDGDLELARASLAEVRTRADFVVALVHWGGGISDELAEYQPPLGRALLDAGADVVVGSHPHRVLGIEIHESKAIFYSPGTLIEQLSREGIDPELLPIFDLLSPDSFVATLEIEPDGGYGVRIIPATLGEERLPVPAEGEAFERITRRVVEMSAALGTKVRVADDGLLVDTGAAVPA